MNEPFIIDYRGKVKQKLVPKDLVPCLRAEAHGNHPLIVGEYESTYKDTWTRGELNGMKVNSFFCGAGGFDLGFIQAGFEITGAWDFDKYAVQSYNHNIGGAVQADVSLMKGADIPKANGWLFGFPCQDISVAGKQKGMIKGETRSGLFYEIMRLLGEVSDKPEWILAENVKAVKKFIPTIEEEYDKAGYTLVNPQLYNSKLQFVPQNRERYFLMGIRKDLNKSFVFPEQQTDFIPKLSSILESNVDEKYYIDDIKAAKIIEQAMQRVEIKGVHACITPDRVDKRQNGRRAKEEEEPSYTVTAQDLHGIIEPKIEMIGLLDMKGNETVRRVYNPEGLAPTLTTSEGGHRQPKILCVGNTNPSGNGMNGKVYDVEGLAPTVTTNKEIDVAGALTSSDWRGLNQNQSKAAVVELPQYRIRKLTPREYARLQGFPDSYEQVVSNSQFYKQMGNAVTVNVSYFIAKAIKEQL